MKTISVQVPEDFCNDCAFFFTTRTEVMRFIDYNCRRFNTELEPDNDRVHKVFDAEGLVEWKALPCKRCKEAKPINS